MERRGFLKSLSAGAAGAVSTAAAANVVPIKTPEAVPASTRPVGRWYAPKRIDIYGKRFHGRDREGWFLVEEVPTMGDALGRVEFFGVTKDLNGDLRSEKRKATIMVKDITDLGPMKRVSFVVVGSTQRVIT